MKFFMIIMVLAFICYFHNVTTEKGNQDDYDKIHQYKPKVIR